MPAAGGVLQRLADRPFELGAQHVMVSFTVAVPVTIRSRCQTVRFAPLSEDLLTEVLLSQGMVERKEEAKELASLAAGSLDRAIELSDPELRKFRGELLSVLAEPGFDPALLADLAARGHKIVPARPATSANSIAVTKGGVVGAADPRTRGSLAAGY